MKRLLTLFTLVVCLAASAGAAERAHYAGRPLADALRDLEARGLKLVYSSDVVTPRMLVTNEPRATEPRQILDELLREHKLHAEAGPQSSLVIARDRPAPRTAAREAQPQAQAMPKTLEEIVVTPSDFRLFDSDPTRRQFLTREEVRRLPHISDDLYRALSHVPGTVSSDVSATVKIRGGGDDEVEVLLDGMEIYDPFHVRDLFRAFSTIDSEAVGDVNILTGGFPAEYGDRLSGVIDIASLAPGESRKTEVGISLLNMRGLTSGTFAADRGQYLLSFRRGYLREVLDLIDATDINPVYYDLLGRMQYQLGERNIISANVLASRDRLRVDRGERDNLEDATAHYDDRYLWFGLRSVPSTRLSTFTVAGLGQTTKTRAGSYGLPGDSSYGLLDERRSFHFTTLRNDSTYDITPANVVRFGTTLKSERADYRYSGAGSSYGNAINPTSIPLPVSHAANLRASGSDVAFYAADRAKLGQRLVVEAGLRWERQSYTPDGAHVAPRLNAAFAISDRTAVRAAWGRFFQAERIDELQVEDGVTEFAPAQRAEHRVIGIDHAFAHGWSVRAEGYDKKLTDVRQRFVNIWDSVVLFPELRYDRLRLAPESARAHGVELLVRRDGAGSVSGWLSIVRSSVTDRVDGRDVPRAWDQPTAIAFSTNFHKSAAWNFNLSGIYHTGWPTTGISAALAGQQLTIALEPYNRDRFPGYRRIDVRASRRVVTKRGTLTMFLDLYNALNSSNVTRTDGFDLTSNDGQHVAVTPVTESIIGVIPSFGLTWQF